MKLLMCEKCGCMSETIFNVTNGALCLGCKKTLYQELRTWSITGKETAKLKSIGAMVEEFGNEIADQEIERTAKNMKVLLEEIKQQEGVK